MLLQKMTNVRNSSGVMLLQKIINEKNGTGVMLLPPKIITRNQNVQSNVTTKSFDIRDNITSIVWKMTYFGVTWVETRKRDWKLSPFLFCAAF